MTNAKRSVGVLFGGRSGEHEVSLMSARSVLSVLDPQKYVVVPIGITHEGVWVTGPRVLEMLESNTNDRLETSLQPGQENDLTRVTLLPYPGQNTLYALHENGTGTHLKPYAKLDVVFPVLHGTFGEDGTIQGLLELVDLAYVGAGVLGSSVGMDKSLFKDVMRAHGLPVVEWITFSRSDIQNRPQAIIEQAEALAPYPLFTKPANLGSSVGITKCRSRSDLFEGLMEAASYDTHVLVERAVPNVREIEVSVLGNTDARASLPGEVRPSGDFYTYEAKYLDDRSELIIPAPLPADVTARIRQMAVQAFHAADGSGMARVDFLLDGHTNDVYIGEINTLPGFTRISMYPKLWEATGLSYAALVDRLIKLALERKADRDRTERQFRRRG